MKSDTKTLKSLGGKTKYYNKPNIKILETFENQYPNSSYVVPFECFEFSSLCPKTGQPDQSILHITYIPKYKCVESKSLKLYLFAFRNTGQFMEDITNRIANDLFKVLDPLYLEIHSDFNSRGGIYLRPYVQLFDPGLKFNQRGEIRTLIRDWSATKSK